jgi:hypothetical protein
MALQSMMALSSITLQQAVPSVNFFDISQNYRDLVLVTQSPASDNGETLKINNDNSNYSSSILYAFSGNTSGLSYTDTLIRGTTSSNLQRFFIYTVMDYSSTDKHKTILVRGNEGIASLMVAGSRWASTSQVTSLLIEKVGNFPIGTTFSLYGRIA